MDGFKNTTCANNSLRYVMPERVKHIIIALLCLIILVGVVGNVSVILIVTRVKEMRKPVYYCLSSLAISDTLVLLIVPIIPLATLVGDLGGLYGLCKFSAFFDRGVAVASVLTVLAISVERYFAICHPFKARYVLTTKRTLLAILIIWIIATAVSCPYLEMIGYEYKDDRGSMNSTSRGPISRCVFNDKMWMNCYEVIVAVVFFILPGFILSLLYLKIVHTTLCDQRESGDSAMQDLKNVRTNSRKSKQIVFMLASIIVLFIVCVLPHNIFVVIVVCQPDIADILGSRNYAAILWFTRIMMYVNSAGNPVMYNVVSSEYRNALRSALSLKVTWKYNNYHLNNHRPSSYALQ